MSYVSVKDSWRSAGLQMHSRDQNRCESVTSVYTAVLCPHLHFLVLLGADKMFLQLLQKTAGKYSMLFANAS